MGNSVAHNQDLHYHSTQKVGWKQGPSPALKATNRSF